MLKKNIKVPVFFLPELGKTSFVLLENRGEKVYESCLVSIN